MEQTEKKRHKIILVLLGIVVLGVVLFVFSFHVSQIKKEIVVELGEELTTDLHDYISGHEWSVKKAKLDLSNVDLTKVGSYEVSLKHGWQHFTYQIIIEDTVAPAFTEKTDFIYLKVGDSYEENTFYEEVSDRSGEVTVSFKNSFEDTITFSEKGEYQVELTATDASMNQSNLSVPVIVDTAPVISAIPEYYVVQGSNVSLLADITATDDVDGDVTDRIKVEYGDFSWNTLGTHEVTFVVEDSYGLETRENATIHICEEKEICDKIASREISWRDQVISYVPNYYEGGAKEMDSLEEQMEYMLPCVIHIDTDYHTNQVRYVYGSAFIFYMDEKYIYLCSNEHVFSYTEQGTAYFYDGTKATYTVIGMNEEEDVAFAKIAKKDVNEDTLYHLFSVHISEEAYQNILEDHETQLFMEITTDRGLDYTKTGVSVEENDDFYIVNEECLQVTVTMKEGNSGSAIIDEYGNLIGMCVGLRSDPIGRNRYYCIPLKTLIQNYESITGKKLYR